MGQCLSAAGCDSIGRSNQAVKNVPVAHQANATPVHVVANSRAPEVNLAGHPAFGTQQVASLKLSPVSSPGTAVCESASLDSPVPQSQSTQLSKVVPVLHSHRTALDDKPDAQSEPASASENENGSEPDGLQQSAEDSEVVVDACNPGSPNVGAEESRTDAGTAIRSPRNQPKTPLSIASMLHFVGFKRSEVVSTEESYTGLGQMTALPPAVAVMLGAGLEWRDLARLSQTCRFWRDVVQQDSLWKPLAYQVAQTCPYIQDWQQAHAHQPDTPSAPSLSGIIEALGRGIASSKGGFGPYCQLYFSFISDVPRSSSVVLSRTIAKACFGCVLPGQYTVMWSLQLKGAKLAAQSYLRCDTCLTVDPVFSLSGSTSQCRSSGGSRTGWCTQRQLQAFEKKFGKGCWFSTALCRPVTISDVSTVEVLLSDLSTISGLTVGQVALIKEC